jgi:Las17-binding protein actin regulator
LQIGADITDFVIVLNSEEAVRAFSMGGNLTVGGNISAAAGPIGTGGAIQASLASPAPMFSYSKSKGISTDDCSSFLCASFIPLYRSRWLVVWAMGPASLFYNPGVDCWLTDLYV